MECPIIINVPLYKEFLPENYPLFTGFDDESIFKCI